MDEEIKEIEQQIINIKKEVTKAVSSKLWTERNNPTIDEVLNVLGSVSQLAWCVNHKRKLYALYNAKKKF